MILDLKKIQRIKTLSQYLELDETVIKKLAEDETEREISLIIIHQRNKERKVAKVQSNTYKQILKNIAAYLNVQYKTPEYVFGYVKRKSILKNSGQHVGKKYIIKADIKDFFYSIKFDKVKKMFLSFTSNDEIATLLSKLVTYDGQLYLGLITSPIISNIILKDLDKDFITLSSKYDCVYSRYADDITISSDNKYPSKEEIINILFKYNFCLNEKKFKIMKRGQTQVVTGLSVFDQTPRIPRKVKNKIRTACFLYTRIPSERFKKTVSWCSIIELEGLLNFYSKIEPEFIEKMRYLKRTGKYK